MYFKIRNIILVLLVILFNIDCFHQKIDSGDLYIKLADNTELKIGDYLVINETVTKCKCILFD